MSIELEVEEPWRIWWSKRSKSPRCLMCRWTCIRKHIKQAELRPGITSQTIYVWKWEQELLLLWRLPGANLSFVTWESIGLIVHIQSIWKIRGTKLSKIEVVHLFWLNFRYIRISRVQLNIMLWSCSILNVMERLQLVKRLAASMRSLQKTCPRDEASLWN